jgi:hypothetical protein
VSTLGTGTYEVYLTDRGGGPFIDKVPAITTLRWNRLRDDISSASVFIESPSAECAAILGAARTVRNEVVIFRNGDRVWEGPITLLQYRKGQITVEAKDPLWYASRRALNPGIDWSKVGGSVSNPNDGPGQDIVPGLLPVLRQAFGDGTSDPYGFNVGKWLLPISGPDNPYSKRIVPRYSRTVWEVLDSLAEDGGLDYTVIGRRIMWWDTHLRAFILPRLTDDDFMDSLVVNEYGSDLATRRFRTDNAGKVTSAVAPSEWLTYYGPIDTVVSSTEETVPDATSPEAEAGVASDLAAQYPAPVHVHLPDGTALSCDAPVGINELIPGAWVPLYSTLTARKVEQWMKVDSVNVDWDATGERVSMNLIPGTATFVDLP